MIRNEQARRRFVAAAIVATLSVGSIQLLAQRQRVSLSSPKEIEGLWLNDTMTPLVRPPGFTDRTFFTDEEARDYQADYGRRTRLRGGAFELEVNSDEFEPGHLLPDMRTSLIVDPPDGKIPALTFTAQTRAAAEAQRRHDHFADGPEDLNLSERCLLHLGGPPMMPMPQNNNVQIVQTSDYVMILNETNHEFRVIPLDGRPHLPATIRQWKGDSRGRWEGTTLVVDTTNFTDQTTFNGSGAGLHVVERFTRTDDRTLRYAFTIDDPESFVRSWSAVSSMTTSAGPLFEFACHEGDRSMENMLKGARFEDPAR